jgi:hypothetical protein
LDEEWRWGIGDTEACIVCHQLTLEALSLPPKLTLDNMSKDLSE